jgi:nucleoside deoxyribosyltransferase
MKIYLASPFFNQEERENVIKVATQWRNAGHEVYVPMEHEIENAWSLPNNVWANRVFEEDVKAIRECDRVLAITYGMIDDAGTSWEIGFAYGIEKPVDVIAVNKTTYSLMVYQSCDEVLDIDSTFLKKETFLQS